MTAFSNETVLELTYDDESLARIVSRSVAREVGEIDDHRSETTVSRNGATVTFAVRARDLTALRAATNTWLRLATVAERTAGLV
jgi:KEOPS complex subunit Pcc1